MGPIGSDACRFVRADSPLWEACRSLAIWLPKATLARRSGGWVIRGQTVASYLRGYFSAGAEVSMDHGVRFQQEFVALPARAGFLSRKPAGTAFALSTDLVVTAGHCLKEVHGSALYGLHELCLAFAYGRHAQNGRFLSAWQLVDGKDMRLEAGSFCPADIRVADVAVLRMPPMKGIGLPVAAAESAVEGQAIYMLGHRHGLPVTSSRGRITSILKRNLPFVFADLTMFEGHSGSPVIDGASQRVLGWAVGGLPHVGYGLSRAGEKGMKVMPMKQPRIRATGYAYTQSDAAGIRVMMLDRCLHGSFENFSKTNVRYSAVT